MTRPATLRFARPLALLALAGAAVAGCTTTGGPPPAQVVRYHLDQPIARGTVAVQPMTPEAGTSLSFAPYAAAVQAQLVALGYTAAPAGVQPDYIALADVHQDMQVGPPRRSPISIGIGGSSFSGGRGGGVGLGGGVGFPIGGGHGRAMQMTELSVTIKRRADQTAVWEGHARGVVDVRAPDAVPDAQAGRLASALFGGFPGESGRTVDVR